MELNIHTVVIVEDKDYLYSLMQRVLQKMADAENITIKIVPFGALNPAYDYIRGNKPSVISTDMGFPIFEGEPVTEEFMGVRLIQFLIESEIDSPIVVYSSKEKDAITKKFEESGIDFPGERIFDKFESKEWAQAIINILKKQ